MIRSQASLLAYGRRILKTLKPTNLHHLFSEITGDPPPALSGWRGKGKDCKKHTVVLIYHYRMNTCIITMALSVAEGQRDTTRHG